LMVRQINELEKQDFNMIIVDNLPDGTYQGSASALLVNAQAKVIISSGHIENITLLEHNHGPGYGAEAICDVIVKANSPDVDVISGATASSTVVKSAVLEALKAAGSP
jgi:uncharacterized protein with FMN-binding domain